MNELNYPETTKHVIVHNNETFSYHIVESQNCFATGQPYVEIFDSEEEAKQAFPQAFHTIEEAQTLANNNSEIGFSDIINTEEEPYTSESDIISNL